MKKGIAWLIWLGASLSTLYRHWGRPRFVARVNVPPPIPAGSSRLSQPKQPLKEEPPAEPVPPAGLDRPPLEEQLLDSERRFQDIAENVDEIFWIRDLHRPTFLYMNPAYQTYSGRSPQTVYANPLSFLEAILPEDQSIAREAFISPQPHSHFRFRIRHLDGRLFWMQARIFLALDPAGVPLRRIGVATDITSAIDKERILEESLANERRLNQLKSRFIETASHEFRTPLTVLQSSVDLITEYVDREADRPATALITRHLKVITQQVKALTTLIGDTLTLSQIEAEKVPVHPQWTDLVLFSRRLIESSFGTERASSRPVQLEVRGVAVGMVVDRRLLGQILTNLLSNAFKFSTQPPRLSLIFGSTEVRLAVSDAGIGIPENELAFLFSKFFRASNARHIQGTGLGLAICQEYVALLHGRIEVASTVGFGTTFTVILPLDEWHGTD
ncbi:PAS domain-containing sensor histidine kinase [Spirosoma aerophilum]